MQNSELSEQLKTGNLELRNPHRLVRTKEAACLHAKALAQRRSSAARFQKTLWPDFTKKLAKSSQKPLAKNSQV